MFNPKLPHGTVSPPVAGAVFYQGGHHYAPNHQYVFSNPGLAPPPGIKAAVTMDEAIQRFEEAERRKLASPVAEAATAAATTQPSSAPQPPAPPENPPGDSGALTREQQLMQLGVPKLQDLQLQALRALKPGVEDAVLKKELLKGPGVKPRLIAWLLENTAE